MISSTNKTKAVIFDIDGTLADTKEWFDAHRKSNGKAEWKTFREDSANFAPKPAIVNLLKLYSIAGYRIVILTARSVEYLDVTNWWLCKVLGCSYLDEINAILIMQDKSEGISSSFFKQKILMDLFDFYDIELAVEDRDSEVAMFRTLKVPCLQVENNPH